MKKTFFLLVSITLIALLSGCGTAGAFHTNHVTNVELSKPNFNIVAKDVQGSSMQGYLFGASISQGSDVATFGIAKVAGVEKLYDTAIKALWKNYKVKYGGTVGKKIALVNVRHDNEVLNTFVYTQVKYFVTADVVEFVE